MGDLLVSFVMATHNRGAVVVECLRRVVGCGLPGGQFEILVVDNASTDGTGELIARGVPQARVIRLGRNCGPVAKNAALRRARGEFVVLLDDDAYPQPGAVMQMIRHFRADEGLGAAVFDVTLPDGSKEGSAYPDVFIGAGTGIRREVLATTGLLPADFFMQAEEYDLSFRIWQAGYSVQRFWDMPLMHLKTPGARIGQRTSRLDVRNNLWLLAKFVPEPLCHQLAADWLARYWRMALGRDGGQAAHGVEGTHKQAFIRGAAEGLEGWSERRRGARRMLEEVVERIFKFGAIRERLGRLKERLGLRKIALAEFGKNILAFRDAARELDLEVVAVVDDALAGGEYRGIPVVTLGEFRRLYESGVEAVVMTNLSRVHAPQRTAALKRVLRKDLPVVDLFSRGEGLLHGVSGMGLGRVTRELAGGIVAG